MALNGTGTRVWQGTCLTISGCVFSTCSADSPTASRSQQGVANSLLETGSRYTPHGLPIGQSPIPSPQPSFSSSHKSARSSGRGSIRKKLRQHSPGHTSSGSEDTIRVSAKWQRQLALIKFWLALPGTEHVLTGLQRFDSGPSQRKGISDRGGCSKVQGFDPHLRLFRALVVGVAVTGGVVGW